ncbi:MAG: HPr(Ser) kinase/phosphatase [Oscillospiraceae bacterium]|nr:HPr(Ser) kinase/phosphatase [Oscillospiraceae bacterium]
MLWRCLVLDTDYIGNYTIKFREIVKEFSLEVVYGPDGYENRELESTGINRPGLQLAGFFDQFDNKRTVVIGRVERSFLSTLTAEERMVRFGALLDKDIPFVVFTRGIEIFPELIDVAKEHKTPIFRTPETTSEFMSALIAYLKVQLAPRITRHGVLVEIYGEGVLLLGESGVGKSETAIELVKRGHRLIADDAVELKKVSSKSIVGSAPEIIRHFIELRGIGVVDVRRIFGMGSVKLTEKIDLVINLEIWKDGKQYDRFGAETQYMDILGINIPCLTIPVKPGRNLAVILEVAAMNNRHKKMGYNAAEDLSARLSDNFYD